MAKGKNIKKIQEMLNGGSGKSIQVGYGDQDQKSERKVGEIWEDSEGYKWEQKQGFRVKLKATPDVGLFSKQCKDCDRNCSLEKKHKDTWNRFERCFYCQMAFEAKLKSRRIGENNNKHYFWVKKQVLSRWEAMDKDAEAQILEIAEENKKLFDKSVANALANDNISRQRSK